MVRLVILALLIMIGCSNPIDSPPKSHTIQYFITGGRISPRAWVDSASFFYSYDKNGDGKLDYNTESIPRRTVPCDYTWSSEIITILEGHKIYQSFQPDVTSINRIRDAGFSLGDSLDLLTVVIWIDGEIEYILKHTRFTYLASVDLVIEL